MGIDVTSRATSISDAVRDSLPLKLCTAGLALAAIGFVANDGAIPASTVVWGVAPVLAGSASYALITCCTP